jgi:hypothetical protein
MIEQSVALDLPAVDAPERGRIGRAAIWRFSVYAVTLLIAIGWTLALGKDVHWDAVNYHLYLGYAALNDRFGLDFFAAGTPSYINPYAYVPLYLMDRAGVPALGIALVFASIHAAILWLTYELALVAGNGGKRSRPRAFAVLALVFAASNPVLLQGLGSTMADISTGILVVAGWLGISRSLRGDRGHGIAVAGVLCGAAAALKLSNAVFAIAALPMLAFLPGTWRDRLRAALVFGVACGATFVLVSLPWSWRLSQEFGNPLFPFLNTLFVSSDFTSAPLHYERFHPGTLQEFLVRPFRMLSAHSMVHTESRAPDLRYAVLFLALAAWALASLRPSPTRGGSHAVPAVRADARPGASNRVLLGVTAGWIVAWLLWLGLSGNSRYFLPMGCVAGVMLALLLQRLYLRWRDGTLIVVGVILLAQGVQFAVATDWKRDGLRWSGPWLTTEFPGRFRDEPFLFLSASFLSGSAFLPYWHPSSGMMTITGFYALGPDRPGGARAQALIESNVDRLRILLPLPPGAVDRTTLPGPPSDLDVYVRRFGLRVDPTDCEFVRLEANLRGKATEAASTNRWTSFLTCRLERAPGAAEAYARDVQFPDAVFDRVEAACPNLFHPPRPVTEQMPRWVRVYNMGSEMQLWIEDGTVRYRSPIYGGEPVEIGAAKDWASAPQVIDCSRKYVPAFGGLLE